MKTRIGLLNAAIVAACLMGCSSPAISRDGSSGSLQFGADTLSDICVVVHKKDGSSFQGAGFGTTDHNGSFHLVNNGGQEALVLEPGDYCFTLESLGPQIVFPADYLKPETTPLKVTWTTDMKSLDLKVPAELLARLSK